MRTLAINALRLMGKRTAMGRYIELMTHYWSAAPVPFDRIVLYAPGPVSLDGFCLGGRTPVTLRCFPRRIPPVVWEQLFMAQEARRASLLFCPAYIAPLAAARRTVVANHGIYESIPGEFSALTRAKTVPLFRASARRTRRVIANSAQTRRDITTYFGVPENGIDVVYPAARELFFEPHNRAEVARASREALGTDAPYLLFVGKLSKRRNVPSLIAAFAAARREKNLPHRLLIVGPNVNGTPVAEIAAQHGVSDAVTYIPHLEQERLASLYAGADAYVLPTSYEGISWTMLEAMASGTAVLTVDHPTVHEGNGDARDAVLAVPSASVADLAGGISRLLTDKTGRERYAENGRKRARQFSWATAAQQTMAILDREASAADGKG